MSPARSVRDCNKTRHTSALITGRLLRAGRESPSRTPTASDNPPLLSSGQTIARLEAVADTELVSSHEACASRLELCSRSKSRDDSRPDRKFGPPSLSGSRAPMVAQTADSLRRTAPRICCLNLAPNPPLLPRRRKGTLDAGCVDSSEPTRPVHTGPGLPRRVQGFGPLRSVG